MFLKTIKLLLEEAHFLSPEISSQRDQVNTIVISTLWLKKAVFSITKMFKAKTFQ